MAVTLTFPVTLTLALVFVLLRRYINKSIVAGIFYTLAFIVWVCIFQGVISSGDPAEWALSLIVGAVDPVW